MEIEYPKIEQLPQLRQLWKLAFGDTEDFMDGFYGSGFSPERCRCMAAGEDMAAMLYWFDCECQGRRLAYIYGVATHPGYRNRGLCRKLMADTEAVLREQGYWGAILVPQHMPLRKMYASMDYGDAGTVSYVNCVASEGPVSLRKITAKEYAALRRAFLPGGSVLQEGASLPFLERIYELYAGPDFLLAAFREEGFLWGMELLGNKEAAPGILKALGCVKGRFRTPGKDQPFAMYLPLTETAEKPAYFGLAFD